MYVIVLNVYLHAKYNLGSFFLAQTISKYFFNLSIKEKLLLVNLFFNIWNIFNIYFYHVQKYLNNINCKAFQHISANLFIFKYLFSKTCILCLCIIICLFITVSYKKINYKITYNASNHAKYLLQRMHEDWQCIQCNIVKYDRYLEMSVSLLQFLSFLQYMSS